MKSFFRRALTVASPAVLALVPGLVPSAAVAAPPAGHPKAEAQALDLALKAIAIRSVAGEGNRAVDVAALDREALVAGGWAPADVVVTPFGDTAYLVATWPGSDPKLKPLVLSGHMDVVEARRADWVRDPFVPVIENGLLYGRGATDMKFDGAMLLASLLELRHSGFKPRRTIVLAFSGDEETAMATSAKIAGTLANAEMVINADGGGGRFDATNDKPLYWTFGGAEKTYADFRLEVTNPGGHSSAPRPENAIVQLSEVLVRIGAFRFPPEQNAITREWFAKAAQFEPDPAKAAAMRAFSANPDDAAALALLRTDPNLVGKTGTTCVPTLVAGGHALNALPQRATANINCRIFPGHTSAEIAAKLKEVIGNSPATLTDVSLGSIPSPASPLRPDFVKAATKAIHAAWGKDIPVIPVQESGASDSMFYRAAGVAAYNASPIFTRDNEEFSHGLNERVRVVNIGPAITYYLSLIPELTR